jgi:hypothetical protein
MDYSKLVPVSRINKPPRNFGRKIVPSSRAKYFAETVSAVVYTDRELLGP